MRQKISLLLCCWGLCSLVFAQANLEESESLNQATDDMQFADEVRKLNLSWASESELNALHVLTDVQLAAFIAHRETYGKLHSLFELQAVAQFDSLTIQQLLPFVTVDDEDEFYDFSLKRLCDEGEHQLVARARYVVQEEAGFSSDSPGFSGNRAAEVIRYKFNYRRNLWIQALVENDAGESWKKGPDFLSASLGIRNLGKCKQLVVGDYQVQFGQGLACWSGMGFGKSAASVSTRKTAVGIRSYSSVNEANFCRGLATTWRVRNLEVTGFFSKRNLDSSVQLDTSGTVTDWGSIIQSGYHRTLSELATRGTLEQVVYGGHLALPLRRLRCGITAMEERKSAFQSDIRRDVFSLSVESPWRNGVLFGECASNGTPVLSGIVGTTAALHQRFSLSLVSRFYNSRFESIASNVLAEGNGLSPSAEQGCYLGMQWQLAKRSVLNAYYDCAFFNGSRYQITGSSWVTDRLIQYTFSPDRKSQFYLRLKWKSTVEDATSETRLGQPLQKDFVQLRCNASLSIHPEWKWHVRIETNRLYYANRFSDQGFLVLQDLTWKRMNFPVTFTLRYALFNAEAWDVRSYAYENDVQYSYSIPAYYGKGSRWYVLVKYQWGRNTDVWLRIANWGYTDRSAISSGVSAIYGNQKTECTLQVRIQF